MELREIKALLALMRDFGLSELEIEDKKGKVRLVRGPAAQDARPAVEPARVAARSAVPKRTAPGGEPDSKRQRGEAPALAANQKLVASPMVGTFYRAAAPNAAPFVEEGDTVRKGQPLCIIEAMKMMNEIEAEAAGRVVRILCDNGQPVEYGQPLFSIKPDKK